MIDSLDALREGLTETQHQLVDAVWAYYRQRRHWMPQKVLHHQFLRVAKSAIREALSRLGGSIIFEYRENGRECYRLTFLGVLLTAQGADSEGLLGRYLEWIRERYMSDPEAEQVNDKEVESALQLTSEELFLLRELIDLSNIGGLAMFGPGTWAARVPMDVDEFPAIVEFRHYVCERAMSSYDAGVPIDEAGRMRHNFNVRREDREKNAQHTEASGTALFAELFHSGASDLASEMPENGERPDGYDLGTLHLEIYRKCAGLFQKRAYAAAVEMGFKVVRDRLRDLTGYETGADAFGRGKLYVHGAVAPHVDREFNEGVKFLTMAVDRFRNEKSHSSDAAMDDPLRAYEYLRLSSLAMNLLNNSQVPPGSREEKGVTRKHPRSAQLHSGLRDARRRKGPRDESSLG